MKHTAEKRFLSMLLAMVMILAMLPISALAKSSFNTTVLDGKISVVTTGGTSGQKGATVNSDGTLKMAVTAVTGCNGSFESTANHVVTLTNVTAEELMVSFDYGSLTNLGTLKIDGAAKTLAGNYAKTLAANGTIVIELTSASNSAETSVLLSNFELKDTSTKAVTVTKTENGSVTVNGTALSGASVTVNADYATGVKVVATPASGYVFAAWLDSNYKVVSTEATALIQPLQDMVIGAYFVPNDNQAYWLAADTLHTDLNTACAAAQGADKTVVLVKSGTLPSGTHTIPADVSVLIPFDAAHTSYGTGDPELAPNNSSQAFVAPTPYRTLIMASGAKLVVNGMLELAAKHHVAAGHETGSNGGAIWGKFGHIDMAANSEIAVNGTLCAWGMVTGKGEVIANSGSFVYEKMQIADYRGGGATSGLATTYASRKLFPFSQYYVQNVEVKETIHSGATLLVNVGVYLSASEQSTVPFVGSSGAMFTLGQGAYVTKTYDAANDRLKLDAYGNTSLSSINLSFEGQSVNSSSFRLGLNNNIDIHIHSGITTISQDVVLQAGATVTVDKEAAVYNASNLFAMDAEDWGTFARGKTIRPIMWSYANGRTVKRTTVTDAIVDINGTVINGGQLFSTGSDSFISSEKTGVVVFSTPAESSATLYQLTHNDFTLGMTSNWTEIACTAAILVNGDKTTVTANGGQYDAFIYDTFQDKWIQKNIYNGGAGYVATATYNLNGAAGTVPAAVPVDYLTNVGTFAEVGVLAPFAFAITDAVPTREGYNFIGWSTDAAATEAEVTAGKYVSIAADTTLYAVWDANSYTLTVDGVSKDVDCGTDLSTLITEPTKDGFKFAGWTVTKGDGTAIEQPATMPAYDVIFTANWEEIPSYTLTFLNENGTAIFNEELEEGEAISAPVYAPEGYTFKGWLNPATGAIETIPSVMPGQDLEFQAVLERITYTITFVDGTADVGEVTVNYGEKATLLDALTKENLVFQGWGASADQKDYEAGATIDVTSDMTLYAVWHSHSYSESVTTQPGCKTEGVKTFTCSCSDSYTESIPALGHTEETIPGTAADCENTGLTDGVKCSVCGKILTAQEEIPALGHTEETIPAVDPDCTNTGLTAGTKCSVCGEIITAQEEIPALGHSFVNGGCENCDAEIQVSLPGSFNGWDTNAWIMTRNEDGTYTYEVRLEAGEYTFKVMDDGVWMGNGGLMCDHTDGYEWSFDSSNGDCMLYASGGTYTFTYNINTKGLKVDAVLDHVHDYNATFTWSDYYTTCSLTLTCDCGDSFTNDIGIDKSLNNGKLFFTAFFGEYSDTVSVDPDTYNVIYVDVSAMGWTNVNAYCWNNATEEKMAAWPGTAMDHVSDSVYSILVPDGFDMIIFNNGSSQTGDLNMPTLGENIAVVKDGVITDWGYMDPPTYTITFTDEPGYEMAQWSYTITKPYGAPITEEDKAALEAAMPTVENYYINDWHLPDYEIVEIPETMPNYDQTFYASWRGVESFVTFYSDASMSEESLLFVACFRYGEYYDDLDSLVIVNRLDEETPADHHVAAIKYADGTEMQFPYTHGTEGFSVYVVFERNDCEVHTEETVPGYAATCTEPGLTDGVKCSVCGETLVAQEEIPALGHTEEVVSGYAASCTEPGLTDGSKCSVCGEIITAQEEIPANGHSFVDGVCGICGAESHMTIYFQNNWLWSDVKLYFWGSEIETGADWRGNTMSYYDNDGTYDYYVLEVPTDIDGMVINGIRNDGSGNSDQTPDITGGWYDGICYYMYWDNSNKAGSFNISDVEFACKHVGETVSGYAATCTEPGLTDGVKCSVCGEILVAQEEIPALGHTEETIPGYAADCENTGLTDGVKCSVCGEIITAQEEIPALGHSKPVYINNGDTHMVDYPCCDAMDIAAEAHIYGDGDYICECGAAYTGIYEETNGDLYYVENGVVVENKGLVKVTDDNGHIHYYYFGCGVENCSAGDACQGSFKAQKSNRHYAAITNGYLVEGGYTTGDDGVIEHIEDTSVSGIYEIDGVKYCLMDGVKVAKGLFEQDGKFYYARSNGALVIGQNYWVSKTNGLTNHGEAIKAGTYTFDENGAIVFPEDKNGFYFENGAWHYYVDNALNYAGLIWCDGPEGNDPGYYYVNSKCQLVTDCAYWISKNNGHMKNQTYYFDENGTMYTPAPKNGFYFENDAWYYYVDGELNYAGLIWCDGPEGNDPGYYYVNSKCMLITDCEYWISKNNGIMKNQTYTFDANGTMVQETGDNDQLLNGFVEEDGELYYYVDGIKTYAGLILVDGNYYYVNSKGRVIRDCTYWISKNNGYMKNGNYTFDAEGKMILN